MAAGMNPFKVEGCRPLVVATRYFSETAVINKLPAAVGSRKEMVCAATGLLLYSKLNSVDELSDFSGSSSRQFTAAKWQATETVPRGAVMDWDGTKTLPPNTNHFEYQRPIPIMVYSCQVGEVHIKEAKAPLS